MRADGDHSRRPGASDARLGQATFLDLQAGPHRLLMALPTVLAVESEGETVEHEAILGPVDLREWLGVPPLDAHHATILVPGQLAVYRLVACRITRLVRADLPELFAPPAVLRAHFERLCLRGVVRLGEGLAFLADPERLAERAYRRPLESAR